MKEKSVAFTKGKSKFLKNKRRESDFLWRTEVSSFRVVETYNKKLSPETEHISCLTNCLTISDSWSYEMKNF